MLRTLGAACLVLALGSAASAQEHPPLVFAAASLKTALDDVVAQYRRDTGTPVTVSYGASSTLARQIEAAAPADIFISADLDWMDYVAARKLIRPESRKNLLGNRLVLITGNSGPSVDIAPGFPLATLLGGGRLAMADTSAVPAGKYGRAALEALGVWPAVETRIAQAENVRAALALVARGEAPFGIVYETDATAEPNVKIAGLFPQTAYPPIVYPAAQLAASTNTAAAAFLAYIESDRAAPLFQRQGFSVLR